MKFKVLIIGAGPAGIAAAIQLKRYGIDFCIIEKASIGGLLINANMIENYPGFPKGITGHHMIGLLENHLLNYDIQPIKDEIISIDFNDNFFSAKGKDIYFSEYLVLATGTKPKIPNIIGLMESDGTFLFYEVRELWGISGKHIAVIGSGDAAFDYALSLSPKNEVGIYMRGRHSKAIPALIDEVTSKKKITIHKDHQLKVIDIVNGQIMAEFDINGIRVSKAFDLMLAAVGREPALPRLNFGLDEYIDKTLFMIGDVKNDLFRQATIASADGIRTAMMINQMIKDKNESSC